jgi:excisionase family DNA binding protein
MLPGLRKGLPSFLASPKKITLVESNRWAHGPELGRSGLHGVDQICIDTTVPCEIIAPLPATEYRRARTIHSSVAEAAAPAVLLTPEEAAEILRIGRTTIYGFLKTGELAGIMIGRRRLILRKTLDDYITRRSALAAARPSH